MVYGTESDEGEWRRIRSKFLFECLERNLSKFSSYWFFCCERNKNFIQFGLSSNFTNCLRCANFFEFAWPIRRRRRTGVNESHHIIYSSNYLICRRIGCVSETIDFTPEPWCLSMHKYQPTNQLNLPLFIASHNSMFCVTKRCAWYPNVFLPNLITIIIIFIFDH